MGSIGRFIRFKYGALVINHVSIIRTYNFSNYISYDISITILLLLYLLVAHIF